MFRNRERVALLLGAAAVAAILLLSFVVIPGVSRVRALSRATARAELDLAELRQLHPRLTALDREVRRKMAAVKAAANSHESALARLTTEVQKAGLPQAAFSLKSAGPRTGEFVVEEAFDLKAQNLTYLEAVRLLRHLEKGGLPVVVRSANLKSRYDDSKYVDATLRVGFLTPVKR